MKKILTCFGFLILVLITNAQHNITIQTGTNITTGNNAVIVFENCNLDNASNNASFTNALLTESGTTNTNIGGTGVLDFKQITINKPAATLKMLGDLTIQDKLVFQAGYVDLNTHILSLAPNALFVGEKSSSRLIGDNGGFAAINVIMNNPNLQNPGNLGLSVTSSADMGTVSILRGHKIQSQGGLPFSIKRNYAIESNNGENFNGQMRFAYFDEELAGIDESVLQIWSSIDAANWINRGYTSKDQTLNYLQSNNLSKLEWFTLSNPSPGFGSDPTLEFRDHSMKFKSGVPNLQLNLSPNPILQQQKLSIEVIIDEELKGMIHIISPVGNLIKSQAIKTKIGLQKFLLDTDDLISGIYLVKLELENGAGKVLKLQIQ